MLNYNQIPTVGSQRIRILPVMTA